MDALAYHDRTTHSPSDIHAPTAMAPANRPAPVKRYRALRRVALDTIAPPWSPVLSLVTESSADPLAGTTRSTRPRLDRETVATLCYEATGITSRVTRNGRELRFRTASCTGKLYHVDCYLVCGEVADLPAGVYHFDPETMSLDVLREGEYRGVVAQAAGATDGDGDSSGVATAPLTVITTSSWWRNAWKYGDRTYRHAFWDSGTVLANLLAAAHGLDLRAEVVAGFADPPLVDLLGLDPAEEAPVALTPIGADDRAPDPVSVDPIDPATEPVSPDPQSFPRIEAAWQASALSDGDAVASWRERIRTRGGVGRASAAAGDRISLEPVDPETASARPLHPTVVRRGSCRDYAEAGPSRRQVATILDRATRGVPGDWNGGDGDGLAYLDAYVLATGVDRLPDGTYHFHPDDATLEPLGDVNRETKTHLALDQQWAGDAHVNVYLCADIEAIVETLGNRGYRLAQLEAGVTLGRFYLATYAHRDLGGLGLTFYDEPVTDHLSPRAAEQLPVTLFAFGRRSHE